MTTRTWRCPKCKEESGDSWAQCAGKCPIKASPDYDPATHVAFGNPTPYKVTQK